MKRFLLVLGTVLFLALLVVPSTPASAAGANCVAAPGSGPVGTVFTVYCSGFLPGEVVNAWLTEPDGHAFADPYWLAMTEANKRADSSGNVTYTIVTATHELKVALGEWALTVQGGVSTGIARFTINGGTVGVSGATLAVQGNWVYGEYFLPGEVVTVWLEYPNADCSGTWFPVDVGLSTAFYGNVTADNAGEIAFYFNPGSLSCKGKYHIVARGNSSGWGADAYWTTPNVVVNATASLVASSETVGAYGDTITFYGSGFSPNEILSCWTTNPQGHVVYLDPSADGSGSFAFVYGTGADWWGLWQTSEGPLGEWAMTCRGNSSGLIGIARYTVVGNAIDP